MMLMAFLHSEKLLVFFSDRINIEFFLSWKQSFP